MRDSTKKSTSVYHVHNPKLWSCGDNNSTQCGSGTPRSSLSYHCPPAICPSAGWKHIKRVGEPIHEATVTKPQPPLPTTMVVQRKG